MLWKADKPWDTLERVVDSIREFQSDVNDKLNFVGQRCSMNFSLLFCIALNSVESDKPWDTLERVVDSIREFQSDVNDKLKFVGH